MSKPLNNTEMIKEGLEEVKQVYTEERNYKYIENNKIDSYIKKIEKTIQKLQRNNIDNQDIVEDILIISKDLNEYLKHLDSLIIDLEAEENKKEAKAKHDTRHKLIGVMGGVIRYATYITAQEEEIDELEKWMAEIKDHATTK